MSDRRPLAELLPVVYRLLDADPLGGDGLLVDLLDVLENGVDAVERALLDQLDDAFVETAHPAELTHFAALVGLRETRRAVAEQRALVANVMAFRRRKGTLSVLEDLAAAATGWTATAVEFFPLLATVQHVGHPRPEATATVSVRDPVRARRVGTPFDRHAHTAEVGSVATGRARYNLPNIGLFLWRLESVAEENRPPVALDALRYRVHPLGLDTPLYPARAAGPADAAAGTGPADVPAPMRRHEVHAALDAYYPASVAVYDGTGTVPATDVAVCDLGDDGAGGWWHVPPHANVGLDPERGRLAFREPPVPPVRVTYHRALPALLGGGGYTRPRPTAVGTQPVVALEAGGRVGSTAPATLADALAALADRGGSGAVEILDSARYPVAAPVVVPAGARVTLRAAPREWPVLCPSTPGAEIVLSAGTGAELELDGLLLTDGPVRVTGAPRRLAFRHCTLVPGHAVDPDGIPAAPDGVSLVLDLDAGAATEVVLDHSVSGPMVGDRFRCTVTARDSILACAGGDGRADLVGAWTGAAVPAPLALPGSTHRVVLNVGTARAHLLTLTDPLPDLVAAAAALEKVITQHLIGAAVVVRDDRLVVVADGPEPLRFTDVDPGDDATAEPTATLLGLANGIGCWALRGAAVPDPLPLALPTTLGVVAGPPGPAAAVVAVDVDVAPPPGTAVPHDDLRAALEDALRAAADPDAFVLLRGDRFVAVPGGAGHALRVLDAPAARALGWETDPPAVGGSADGLLPGPPLTLDRVTVLGGVHAQTAEVSDSIVTRALVTARRQVGCVRYSFIGPGSAPPRLFRSRSADADDPGPEFVTTRFGRARYGQLAVRCPATVAEGASDVAEMGAFHDVEQPQRLAALRSLLAEYLRFSSEAGIFLTE